MMSMLESSRSARCSPADQSLGLRRRRVLPTTKAVNVVLSFEEALKLNIAVDEGVRRLNSYNRATKAGKNAGLMLTIYLDQKRIAVNEDKV